MPRGIYFPLNQYMMNDDKDSQLTCFSLSKVILLVRQVFSISPENALESISTKPVKCASGENSGPSGF